MRSDNIQYPRIVVSLATLTVLSRRSRLGRLMTFLAMPSGLGHLRNVCQVVEMAISVHSSAVQVAPGSWEWFVT